MTEGRAPQDRTASFRTNNQRAVEAHAAVAAYARTAPRETGSAAPQPTRNGHRQEPRPGTSCPPRTPPAPWKDTVEPDTLTGQPLPQVATDSGGHAPSAAARYPARGPAPA